VATVQFGETKLPEVARRLSVDLDSLLRANPQISDLANLKAGQEIRLPQVRTSQTPVGDSEQASGNQASASDLPRAPVGDPVASTLGQSRFLADTQRTFGGEEAPSTLAPLSGVEVDKSSPKVKTADPEPVITPVCDDAEGTQKAQATLHDLGLPPDPPTITAQDLHKLQPETSMPPADHVMDKDLSLLGSGIVGVGVNDLTTVARIVGTTEGATTLLDAILAPYFGLKIGPPIREDIEASSKARAEAITTMQSEMMLMAVRLSKAAFPQFRPLNLRGEEKVDDDAKRWKDETAQKLDDTLRRAMSTAKMIRSPESAKSYLHESGAKLAKVLDQATVNLANKLMHHYYDPRNWQDSKAVSQLP
jgi:hypothetical protein